MKWNLFRHDQPATDGLVATVMESHQKLWIDIICPFEVQPGTVLRVHLDINGRDREQTKAVVLAP